ncbi:MAG: hypothetical protein U0L11_04765 [Acutalibacteraceae bacterium]|nr:hypothetical protein [Acutalibacteraceae bacterium]
MKKFIAILCLIICIFTFSSCNKTDNTGYFISQLNNSSEELMYYPDILSEYKNCEEIKISVLADSTVTYSLKNKVKAKSGYEYQNINLHIRKHTTDIDASIDSVIDSYTVEKDSAVKAVKHESNGRKYAVTYEIRPDLGYTVLNVIYAASENVSAYFTIQLADTPDSINEKILDKICNDLEIIKI